MKSRTFTCMTAMTLFPALAVPVRLAAQEQSARRTRRTALVMWSPSRG